MDQALERQKGREEEATRAFNQVFQVLAKKTSNAGLPVTASENQDPAARSFWARDYRGAAYG